MVNALENGAEEGRDYLRKASGSWKWALIRWYPNGETQYDSSRIIHDWIHRSWEGNLGNWNILVPRGKEIEWDSVSSGERKRNRPNRSTDRGCRTLVRVTKLMYSRSCWEAAPQRVIVPYAKYINLEEVSWVRRGTWNPVGIYPDHWVSLNTTILPIVNQYREGKVKSTPRGEWNSSWNHMLTRSQSPLMGDGVLFVERAGELRYRARLSGIRGAVVKASLNRAFSTMS